MLTIILAGMLSACDFLDVVPTGNATEVDIYKTQTQAERMVVGCYSEIPDLMQPQKGFPGLMGSGEIVVGHRGTTRWFHYKSLMNSDESSSSTYFVLWSNTTNSYPVDAQKKDIWGAIRKCYNVLNNLDKVPDITKENINLWEGETLLLIGYYHQILLEFCGPIFLAKEGYPQNAENNQMCVPYDECVEFIAKKYDEATKLFPATRTNSEKNRVTSATVLGFKTRLLLYAASPLVNGNTGFYVNFKNPDGKPLMNLTYDREKWKKVMDAAEDAIKLCETNGYKLYGDSTTDWLKGGTNHHEAFVGPKTGSFNNWDEILFGMASQGEISYCIENFAPCVDFDRCNRNGFKGYVFPIRSYVARYFTLEGLPWEDDPDTKNLKSIDIVQSPFFPKEQTSAYRAFREPRFYASIGLGRRPFEVNDGTIMLKRRRGEPQQEDGTRGSEYQSDNGYLCQKWVSTKDTYSPRTNKFTFNSWVFPYLRLAELYLSYVEADTEYNHKLSAKSLKYLNKVCTCNGLPTFQESWSYAGGVPTDIAKLRQVIRNECSNELAMEGRGFHDIRRWKILEKVLRPKEKSWNTAGRIAKEYYRLTEMNDGDCADRSTIEIPKCYWLAISIDQIQIDPSLVQNPGY